MSDKKKVTRIEVIDSKGRSYVNMKVDKFDLQYQDEGRTLKIFITENKTAKEMVDNAYEGIKDTVQFFKDKISNASKKKK